jgi:hypothetical protein
MSLYRLPSGRVGVTHQSKQKAKLYFHLLEFYVSVMVLAGMNNKTIIFWDMTPCSLVDRYQHFRGTYHLHLHGRKSYFEDAEGRIYP